MAMMKPAGPLPLTDECHHYSDKGEVPWDIQNYWQQRYSIFSNYDDGVVMTDEAWFGVTPEPVAWHITEDILGWEHPKTTLVDLFAGAGGNSIAFALSGHFSTVIAIERDPATLACAQHNATLYGVPTEKIIWVLGDSFEYLSRALGQQKQRTEKLDPALRIEPAATVLFASPPWGGPGYRTDQVFDLSLMQPYSLAELHGACRAVDHALYLPRTSDVRQIARLVPDGEKIDVVQYCMNGASKAMVAYIPGQI